MLVDEFRRLNIAHDLHVLPCGHYSTGVTPFKWIDGLDALPVSESESLSRFNVRKLRMPSSNEGRSQMCASSVGSSNRGFAALAGLLWLSVILERRRRATGT